MNKFKKIFGLDAKSVWVKKRVYKYGISCPKLMDGSFYVSSDGRTTSYYNGSMSSKLEQLKYRAKSMSFSDGFWFLRKKAEELGFNFSYEMYV